MKNKLLVGIPTLLILLIWLLTNSVAPSGEKISANNESGRRPHDTTVPHTPHKANFCGEELPLDRVDVYEQLDREIITNTFWHTNTLLVLKRSTRFFPIIEPILKEYGVPDDIKYLCVAESNLIPTAKSPAGAVGLWQFMEGTAKEYGLKVNAEVDERMDIEKSTRAACVMLKNDYGKLGSWALVAAAYNAGSGRVKKVQQAQLQNSYYDLLWGEETGRYVYRIVAMKQVLTSPRSYGFDIDDDEAYLPYETKTITIDTSIQDIAQWAIENGTNYRTIKLLNPWLTKNKLTINGSETYDIKLLAN